ncbi:HEXXH motif domain-containing protein [Actinocrispum sp. NPDC049592]|uniref:HEXXH motif domain-containing protein n=1 Tax=Actinocrispum sp. NPDC049592 TaxID=3154835 RepID=UPI00341A6850
MTNDSLDAFAAGSSDAVGRKLLRSIQLSKHLLLFRELITQVDDNDARLKAGLDLFLKADNKNRDAALTVIGYPHTGAWLMRCLRTHDDPQWTDLAHLNNVAVAAAIRAGLDFAIPVPVRDGKVHLPTMGAADVNPHSQNVTASGKDGRYWIDSVELPTDPRQDGPGWHAVHALGPVLLDDQDPYRPIAKLGFAQRLSPADAAKWRETFDAAMAVMADRVWIDEVNELIMSIVPLRRTETGHGISETSRDALGSFSMTLPTTADSFAATLIHEAQHNKLSALLTALPLLDEAPVQRYYSPWRGDPRPPYGLLHGCYAFMAVTDFWGSRRTVSEVAAFEYLRGVRQVRTGLRTLIDIPNLTAAGKDFVSAMLEKAETWDTTGISDEVVAIVDDAIDEHWITWCLANRLVTPEDVTTLKTAWLNGSAPGPLPPARVTGPAPVVLTENPRLRLASLRLASVEQFETLRDKAHQAEYPGLTPGNTALVERDYRTAWNSFAAEASENATATWIGLALAGYRTGQSPLWAERPELVRALCEQLDDPAPDAVADWLSGR